MCATRTCGREPVGTLYFDTRPWAWTDWEMHVLVRARIDRRTESSRFALELVSAFAVIAGALAMLGLFTLMAYTVAPRMREIGIRLALGSTPRGAARLVLSYAARLALIGVTIGGLAAVALTNFIEEHLFSVASTDPFTYVTIAVLLTALASAAVSNS